jgi:hypothetical protein
MSTRVAAAVTPNSEMGDVTGLEPSQVRTGAAHPQQGRSVSTDLCGLRSDPAPPIYCSHARRTRLTGQDLPSIGAERIQ